MSVELSYEITEDTLGEGSAYPCSAGASAGLDRCLYRTIPEVLLSEFGCTVPYLPGSQPVCDPANRTLREAVFRR